MLLDRGGNDFYSARNARPGQGLNRGLGIFIDTAGQDRYSVKLPESLLIRSAFSSMSTGMIALPKG